MGAAQNMLKRNMFIKQVMIGMPNAIDHDNKYEPVMIEGNIRDAILDVANWKVTAALLALLQPLCCAITHLEGNEATLFAVWMCFLHVTCHMQTIKQSILNTLDID